MKYTGDYKKEISFPLGGIGTGSIGIDGAGRLIDWEIFNRPSKGSINPNTGFAIRATKGDESVTHMLCGDVTDNLVGQYGGQSYSGFGFGPSNRMFCGFPHFKDVEFDGAFPIAKLSFCDAKFFGKVKMTAFNPFIPNDADNSSIPAAFFELEIENDTDETVEYKISLSAGNPFGVKDKYTTHNEEKSLDGVHILKMSRGGAEKDDENYGDISIATDCENVKIQEYWYRGNWQDDIVSYWNELSRDGELRERHYDTDGTNDTGAVCATVCCEAGTTRKIRFVLAWNMPNNYCYWRKVLDENENNKKWKNYYATLFESSAETAAYALGNWDMLYSRTRAFAEILHSSTLPSEVIDAASANLSVLKSPTVLRMEDGAFYGWEGVQEKEGSCEGTCQHVWNYAYAMCFLFPRLERTIRDWEFKDCTAPDGRMAFRLKLPVDTEMTKFRACLDGQMGAVIKSYREWKLSGDDKWLSENWENIKLVLSYAWSDANPDRWDADRDGVLEGRQHHTLDMEMFGPSSWLEGMYLAALAAAKEMAEYLGDENAAKDYGELLEKGKKWTKENLFNGKYFVQKVDLADKALVESFDACDAYWNEETGEIKYQIGEGSEIDQLLAQWHCDILGLGDVFDSEQTDIALGEMMKNNFKPSMRYFTNPWRIFSINDESASVMCDYPEGSRKPRIPIPYCEESMTGFEYSFAGLLCTRGKIEDGLRVVRAVRDRFDGKKRNPWNEFECGSNYARSMASYALVPILSGFEFDLPHGYVGFKPYKDGDFSCIWSVDGAWGKIEIKESGANLTVCEGCLTLSAFGAKFLESAKTLSIDGEKCGFEFENGVLSFDKTEIRHELVIEK